MPIDWNETGALVVGLVGAAAGVVAAVAAVRGVRIGRRTLTLMASDLDLTQKTLDLQLAAHAREIERDRPLFAPEFSAEGSRQLVWLRHVRGAASTPWTVVSFRTLTPAVGMLRRSDGGQVSGSPAELLRTSRQLPPDFHLNEEPIRFFVEFADPESQAIAKVEIALQRLGGGEYTVPLDVPAPSQGASGSR